MLGEESFAGVEVSRVVERLQFGLARVVFER